MFNLLSFVIVILLVPSSGSAQPTGWKKPLSTFDYATIDHPNATETELRAVNEAGYTAGGAPGGNDISVRTDNGFRRDSKGNVIAWDGVPLNGLTIANGMNNAGIIVGSTKGTGPVYGFWYDPVANSSTLIYGPHTPFPDAMHVNFNDINDVGTVVGDYAEQGYAWIRGFVRSRDGTFTSIVHPQGQFHTVVHGINNAGMMVGEYGGGHSYKGFLLTTGGYGTIEYPGANVVSTAALGINDVGDIVGSYTMSPSPRQSDKGFLRTAEGQYVTIDVPNSKWTEATGIDDMGRIVGTYADATGKRHGFIATKKLPQLPMGPQGTGPMFPFP